jgi:hypothetical protein
MRRLPHEPDMVSTAANFAAFVARRMGRRRRAGG